jgi:hypothetical protein
LPNDVDGLKSEAEKMRRENLETAGNQMIQTSPVNIRPQMEKAQPSAVMGVKYLSEKYFGPEKEMWSELGTWNNRI